jgi:small subunit ribosomal protein S16
MLVIRMQRTGRKGHAMFRMVVQDSRQTPTSGKVVALIGSYDPHAKTAQLDKEKASFFLEHGAQPSPRVARLLQTEKVKLPSWVSLPTEKKRTIRHADKLRKNQPKQEAAPAEAPSAEPIAEVTETAEAPAAEPEEKAPAATETVEPEAPAEENDGKTEDQHKA